VPDQPTPDQPAPQAETTRPRRRKERGGGADAMSRGYAKAEIKNQKAREALEPLEEGERPLVVTVAAVFAFIVAALLWGSAIFALVTDQKVNGAHVNVAQWALLAAVITWMAWGMWKAKYWAVLGFQMLLVLLILAAVLGLVLAPTFLQIIGDLVLTIGLGTLFYFMVKAMARIQMPENPGK